MTDATTNVFVTVVISLVKKAAICVDVDGMTMVGTVVVVVVCEVTAHAVPVVVGIVVQTDDVD